MKNVKDLSQEELAALIEDMENNGLKVGPKPLDGGGGNAYAQCVAAHAGQCGVCDSTGAFTPCS